MSRLDRLLPTPRPSCPVCGWPLEGATVRPQPATRLQRRAWVCVRCGASFRTQGRSLVRTAPLRASPLLPGLKLALDQLVGAPGVIDGEPTPEHRRAFDDATRAFLAAGPELLEQATEHLWAYYRDTAEQCAAQGWDSRGVPELGESSDIWAEVTLTDPPALTPGEEPLEPASAYVSFEGDVSWEPEHGLQLVFEDGRAVCKVGPYDGHTTNAHAYDDPSLLGVVYR